MSANSGGVYGAADYFITGTWQEFEGFRDHSQAESTRGSINVGYRLTENVETRFYLNAMRIDQQLPGQVSRQQALIAAEQAAAGNIAQDWQLNIEFFRLANKTTVRVAPGTIIEVGAFYYQNDTDHPIVIYVDWNFEDYGAFARVTDARRIAGFKNRFVAGVNVITVRSTISSSSIPAMPRRAFSSMTLMTNPRIPPPMRKTAST